MLMMRVMVYAMVASVTDAMVAHLTQTCFKFGYKTQPQSRFATLTGLKGK